MKSLDRFIFGIIALALSIIALNPWFAPGRAGAAGGIVDVNIRQIGGSSLRPGIALPVKIVN